MVDDQDLPSGYLPSLTLPKTVEEGFQRIVQLNVDIAQTRLSIHTIYSSRQNTWQSKYLTKYLEEGESHSRCQTIADIAARNLSIQLREHEADLAAMEDERTTLRDWVQFLQQGEIGDG